MLNGGKILNALYQKHCEEFSIIKAHITTNQFTLSELIEESERILINYAKGIQALSI
ncbi:hypothetical protein PD280_06025 [Virgibacillus salarius]|uniref:hypothetical protein n=1 Tax=Virgibacillus salarius TaxID=447199 RepID=UPI002493433E|nr:hypothetical protein [Virgibacillus salarius]WBX81277.1 hypothetical protein PD280_06025 [Virgibacillus salarius]